MATAPPTINALPAPPDPNDRSTFNARAYPWSVAQQTLANEVGAVAANVFSNATEATEAAARAVPAAAAAEAASNAAPWVSGATYAAGDVVWSPINALSHRRRTPGAGTTDPSADPVNWARLVGSAPSIARVPRTSNTQLVAADAGKWIDATSGTFTQTFAAVATLGDGWYCYLGNSGTGDITLDPNSTELIDGLSSYVMYPGEVRLVQRDGTELRSIVLNAFSKTFTSSGTFTKSPGYSSFGGLLWAAGASGGKDPAYVNGGGGGACAPFIMPSSALSATVSVVIGAGGAPVSTVTGEPGGDSTFNDISAFGGAAAGTLAGDGHGGDAFYTPISLADSPAIAGSEGGNSAVALYGGGASGSLSGRGRTVYGGAGGGSINSSTALPTYSTSIFGGAGGDSADSSNGAAGSAPGGGGGSTRTGALSGAGARGELRIWGVI